MPAEPINYKVYYDTNALQGKFILESNVADALALAAKSGIVKIDYILPELVEEEWLQHYLEHSTLQIEKATEVAKKLKTMKVEGVKIKLPNKSELRTHGVRYLRDLGFTTAMTPFGDIDWQDLLLHRAVQKKSPFTDGDLKGTKDAVIAQTIVNHFGKTAAKHSIAVALTADKALIEYLRELEPDSAKLLIFTTSIEFMNHIELKANKLSEGLAKEAATRFYNPRDKGSSVFECAGLYNKMHTYYHKNFPDEYVAASHIDSLPSSKTLRSGAVPKLISALSTPEFGKATYEIGETAFQSRSGKTLHWKTNVEYIQEYQLHSTMGDIAPVSGYPVVVHSIMYEVDWKTTIGKSLALTKPVISRMQAVSEQKFVSRYGVAATSAFEALIGLPGVDLGFSKAIARGTIGADVFKSASKPLTDAFSSTAYDGITGLVSSYGMPKLSDMLRDTLSKPKPFWNNDKHHGRLI